MKVFLASLLVVAAVVNTQTAPDACITTCALEACADGLTDVVCLCSSTLEIGQCIAANCSAADLTYATSLSGICGKSLVCVHAD
jgi:hypothetical protein